MLAIVYITEPQKTSARTLIHLLNNRTRGRSRMGGKKMLLAKNRLRENEKIRINFYKLYVKIIAYIIYT